jgi:hypothetical protein
MDSEEDWEDMLDSDDEDEAVVPQKEGEQTHADDGEMVSKLQNVVQIESTVKPKQKKARKKDVYELADEKYEANQ